MIRWLVPSAAIVATTIVVVATVREARQTSAAPVVVAAATLPSVGTSRAQLAETVSAMTARLQAHPDDGAAVIRLADTLLRLQRVNNDARAVDEAETRLRTFLASHPGDYEGQRMLAAVLLAQHRFGAAIKQANKVQALDPRDAWNYGAQGDGYLELGDYPRAFAAYDTMGRLQPGPPAYARVAYALELQGDLDGALEYMQRAADGTSPNDSEAQAWHYAQVGELWLLKGRLGDARREFERAAATFPQHPYAHAGLARIKIAEGDLKDARLMFQAQLAQGPTAETAAIVGDLSAEIGDAATAAQYYAMAEQIERSALTSGVRQPDRLARFLAERGRNHAEAVALAEEAANTRRDVMTLDTQAWAYFQAGRLSDARRVLAEALRLGPRDPRMLYHAAAIVAASGDRIAATALLDRIVAPDAVPDVLVARGIKALRQH